MHIRVIVELCFNITEISVVLLENTVDDVIQKRGCRLCKRHVGGVLG